MNFGYKIVLVFATISVIVSCKNNGNNTSKKSFEQGGGTFVMVGESEIKTIFPNALTNQTEGIVASQIHEGLLRLNPASLEVVPGLCEKWETSPDGKIITFTLKKGIRFQDDKCYPNGKGPEVTAKDVKFSFELLCTKTEQNNRFESTLKDRVLGANDFFEGKSKSISGFKIIDNHTFSVQLVNPSLSFLKILTNPSVVVVNEIAYKTYGNQLKNGAGPYIYDATSSSDRIVLVKNPNYYATDSLGNSLPYLDTVIVRILPSIEEGLSLYENEKVDLINTIPSLRVKDVVEKNVSQFEGHPSKSVLQREPEMISQYYLFNTKQTPYNNVKVRQAINYAINKEKIVENILKGQAIGPAIYGVTPNTFKKYDIKKIDGYEYDVEKAKKLLMEAGYPAGIGFPEMKLLVNSGNSRNSSVAAEIQKQLKENLNINVSFESLPNNEKYELQMHGKSDVYRDGWVADYPSPETFLSLFVGDLVPEDNNAKSYPNSSRYQNKEFDSLFKKGRDASNIDSSYYYFMKAEQLLINDAPLIPLWYEASYKLLSGKVKNLQLNSMRYYDLRAVYKEK